MGRKPVLVMILIFVLIGMLGVAVKVQRVEASGTIYIRADGNVEGTDKIQRDGNIYTFTSNISDSIVVERDNIIVDGGGYTLQGTGADGSRGIDLLDVSNVTIKNIRIDYFDNGIRLYHSSNNIVTGNTIINNNFRGVHLSSDSTNNIVSGNNITANNWVGIVVVFDDNIITGNYIADNEGYGIKLDTADNNVVSENNITNNEYGIHLWGSNNVLRNNSMNNNNYNFGVRGGGINDVDISNTVDGKPIYYWANERDGAVPSDAGYVALIYCTNITVENLNLANNEQGVYLFSTTNSTITKNNIANNEYGIGLQSSSKNIITGNNITNSYYGIRLEVSSKNTITGNYITNNNDGVSVYECSNNNITGNYMTNNRDGIWIFGYSSVNNIVSGNTISDNRYVGIFLGMCLNNIVYHNNFINNMNQATYNPAPPWAPDVPPERNFWDDGYPSGGNYWCDYTGEDANGDGIGDTPYVLYELNQDQYPLIAPVHTFDAGTWEWKQYYVDVASNSTVSDFSFNPDEGPFIRFNVAGEGGTIGFCRVIIPKDLLWVEDGWTVTVGGEPVNYAIIPDEDYTYICFTYQHSTKTVEIQGTHVIPEFPSFLILPLSMIATLLTVIVYRRKHSM